LFLSTLLLIIKLFLYKKNSSPKQTVFKGQTYALSTLPDLRQEVQTYIFFVPPFTLTRTDFTFGFQIWLERL